MKNKILLLSVTFLSTSCASIKEFLADDDYVDPNISHITCQDAFRGLSYKNNTMVNTEDFFAKNLFGKRVGWDLKFKEAQYDKISRYIPDDLKDKRKVKLSTDDDFLLIFQCPNGGVVSARYTGDRNGVRSLKKGKVYRISANITGMDMTLWDKGHTLLSLDSNRGILEIENPELYKKYFSKNDAKDHVETK